MRLIPRAQLLKTNKFLVRSCFALLSFCFQSFAGNGYTGVHAAKPAGTTLNPGDIAIIGYDFSYNPSGAAPIGDDQFSIVNLVDIAAGTTINFTSAGWLGSGFITIVNGTTNFNDGFFTWTVGTDIPVGTVSTFSINPTTTPVVTVSPSNGTLAVTLGLDNTTSTTGFSPNNGNQIFIFQGSNSSPTFIYGINTNATNINTTTGWVTATVANNTAQSALPAGLTNAIPFDGTIAATALPFTTLTNHLNGVYTGPQSADKTTLLEDIGNSANWTTSATSSPTTVYDITPGGTNFPGSNPVFSLVSATAPTVVSNSASGITSTAAVLNGTFTANNASTATSFIYGRSSTLASGNSTVSGSAATVTGATAAAVTANISGLLPGTNYYFQASGNNSVGTTNGSILNFITASNPGGAVISSVTVPANATYVPGQTLTFQVIYASPVVVTGTPELPITLNSGTVDATYQSISADGLTLTFSYTVQTGDNDPDGIALGTALVLNGGTIKDANSLAAVLTLNGVASTTGVLVDGVAPVVSSVTRQTPTGQNVTNTGTASVIYQVVFSKAVTGVTSADFTLTPTGALAGESISGISGSGVTYLVTVGGITGNGSLRLDVKSSGSTIVDAGGLGLSGGFTTGATYIFSTVSIVVTPTSVSAATVGVNYPDASPLATFSASGGTAPYTYSVSAGALPAGLTLNSSTGVLSGTPTAAGSFPVTITATDANSYSGNVSVTISVGSPSISISPATLPNGTYGSLYPTETISATGGTAPYTFSVSSGALPTGLTLNAATGVFSGTPTAPGNFSFTIKATDASTGTGAPFNITQTYAISIAKAPLTITADNQTKIYGAALPTLTASYSGFVNGDNVSSLTTAPTISTTASATSQVAGSPYSITASGAVDPNYIISYVPGNLTVTPAALTITADNQTKVYGAALPTLTASYSGFVNGDNAFSLLAAPTFTTTATATSPVAGNPYVITASGVVDLNYSISYVPGNLTVTSAALTITADNQTKVYGAALPTLTVSYVGFVNGDNASSLTTAPTVSTTAMATSQVAGNPYSVTASGAVDPNYTITYVPGALTIGQAALTITADNQTMTYGSGLPPLTATYSGFVNGDNIASLTVAAGVSTPAISASPAGSYLLTAGGAVDNNYTITYAPGTLTIGQAALTITADNQASVYGGALPGLTVSYSGFVNGDNIASLTTVANATTTGTSASPAGSYPITVSGAVDNNYIITYDPGTLTIGQAALTITADNQTSVYGGALPALTVSYSGFVNGDNIASLTTVANATTTGTSASPAGSYPITASGAVDNNYIITYDPGTLSIGQAALTVTADNQSSVYGGVIPALTVSYSGFVNGDNVASLTTVANATTTGTSASPAGPYPITASGAVDNNYIITYDPGTLSIGQAALTVTADNQSSVYGGVIPALTVSYSGFVNGDNVASLTTAAGATTTGTSASPAGPYPITASGAVDNNYTITYAPGTLTIGQAALTITADNQSSVYGGALPALTVSYSGFVNGDNIASLTTVANATTTGTSASPAGPYPITASGAVDNNYTITYAPGTLTIGQAALTITADNQTSVYGGALPALTVSYSGFVNGDNIASLTTVATATTTGTSASPVGSYPITVSGAVDNNYIITYAPGTLSIGHAALTVTADNQSSVYGGMIPALTVTYSGFVNGDNIASLTTVATASTTGTSASPAGSYPITVSGAVDNNYIISYSPGTLTIGHAALTVTADNQSSVYGGVIPALTVTYSGFVNGDNIASLTTVATASTTGTSASPAGSYPITASGAVDNNYTITYAPGTLTVGQAALIITATNQTKVYGQANPTLGLTYSGFVNGDNSGSLTTQPTISTSATTGSGVGTYPITVSGATASNYTITYANAVLTVTPATLTITASDQTRYYLQSNPVFTVTYSGFVNGDGASVLTNAAVATTSAVTTSLPGTYPITLSGATAANYTIVYQDGTLTIMASLPNVITFPALPVKTYGDADFVISASATSNLPVTFTSSDNSIATVSQDASGNWVVHIVGAGQTTIIADQGGGTPYGPATEVDQVLTINKANQVILFPAPASTGTLGETETLTASASSSLPITYVVTPPTLAAIAGNSVTFTATGTVTITASQPGDNNYNAATSVSDTVQILNGGAFHSGIGVFPNPAHGTLHVRYSDDYLITKIVVFDERGRHTLDVDQVAGGNSDIQLNISSLQPGLYFVQVICIRNSQIVYPVFKVLVY